MFLAALPALLASQQPGSRARPTLSATAAGLGMAGQAGEFRPVTLSYVRHNHACQCHADSALPGLQAAVKL